MIEVNLIPDVKQELLRAKRVRAYVISGAIITGAVAVGLVIVMALYLFTVQGLRSVHADDEIKKKSGELAKVEDLSNLLTIQHQLASIKEMHDTKNVDSRLFDLLAAVNPKDPNRVTVSAAKIDAESKTIVIEGQAVNGFEAAEALKKTILGTKIVYMDTQESSNSTESKPITDTVSTTNMSYGEDATGRKVLRFTISFEYNDAVFANTSANAVIVGPDSKNATDSYQYVPQSLFGQRATSSEGGE